MKIKLLNTITIIFLSISLTLCFDCNDEQYLEVPKFGKIEFCHQKWLYLNLKDFKQGDNIYLELLFSSITFYYNNVPLKISETNNFLEFNHSEIIVSNICYQDKIYTVVDHSCHYQYKLKGNYNYLIIITPVFEYYSHIIEPIILKHKEKHWNDNDIIIVLLILACVIVVFILIGLVFYCIKKNMNVNKNEVIRDFNLENQINQE